MNHTRLLSLIPVVWLLVSLRVLAVVASVAMRCRSILRQREAFWIMVGRVVLRNIRGGCSHNFCAV